MERSARAAYQRFLKANPIAASNPVSPKNIYTMFEPIAAAIKLFVHPESKVAADIKSLNIRIQERLNLYNESFSRRDIVEAYFRSYRLAQAAHWVQVIAGATLAQYSPRGVMRQKLGPNFFNTFPVRMFAEKETVISHLVETGWSDSADKLKNTSLLNDLPVVESSANAIAALKKLGKIFNDLDKVFEFHGGISVAGSGYEGDYRTLNLTKNSILEALNSYIASDDPEVDVSTPYKHITATRRLRHLALEAYDYGYALQKIINSEILAHFDHLQIVFSDSPEFRALLINSEISFANQPINTALYATIELEDDWRNKRDSNSPEYYAELERKAAPTKMYQNLGGGWAWFRIEGSYCPFESFFARHCGRDSAADALFSLRYQDPKREMRWYPYITASWTRLGLSGKGYLTQMKTFYNQRPEADKYGAAMEALFLSPEIACIRPSSYKPETDFHFTDLPEEAQRRILKVKPHINDCGAWERERE